MQQATKRVRCDSDAEHLPWIERRIGCFKDTLAKGNTVCGTVSEDDEGYTINAGGKKGRLFQQIIQLQKSADPYPVLA
jgi:hypothetical protein